MTSIPPQSTYTSDETNIEGQSNNHSHSAPISAPHSDGYTVGAALSSDLTVPSNTQSSKTENVIDTSDVTVQDAEGSLDPDFPEDAALGNHALDNGTSTPTSSSQSPRPGKRKDRSDDEDYIHNDPELYGLRRSVSGALGSLVLPD